MTVPFETDRPVRVCPDPAAPFAAGLILWASLTAGAIGVGIRAWRRWGPA